MIAAESERCADLLCLLRMSEIVLAEPGLDAALPAMVDELLRLDQIRKALIALPEDGDQLSYLAHRGLVGRVAHRRFSEPAPPTLGLALAERHVVERPMEDGEGCVSVPILAGERAIGVLGIELRRGLPLDDWGNELLCTAADYVALALLGRGSAPARPTGRAELRLTRRQQDALFELVEHGSSNEQIGQALQLSARTVKIHLQAAYRALGVSSRGEAIRLMLTQHADWLERERERRLRHAR